MPLIDTIRFITTQETDPYRNLALEEYLLKQVGEREVILYLWQNEKTVVIGKNQNPWKECRIAELEADGGRLVRRLSGGGAVFHDLGNLNFTFLVTKENYDVDKQLEVIVASVNALGIPAEKTGRNDITVCGRKFSGNAFYSDGTHCYHHGTILVKVDMEMLSHYLNVSREKLVTKGVESVRARVTNLTEYAPSLTIERMKQELVHSFRQVYGMEPMELKLSELPSEELARLTQKFSSREWILGRRLEFNYSLDRRFSWGGFELQFIISSGHIAECRAYTDALETGFFEQLSNALTGCDFSSAAMLKELDQLPVSEALWKEDIMNLIREAAI